MFSGRGSSGGIAGRIRDRVRKSKRRRVEELVAEAVKLLKKMRSDEIPLFLVKRDNRLDIEYPENLETIVTNLNEKK